MRTSDRNVVLVSIDSLRADHCGYVDEDRGLTPTMDAMATGGVAFETAVAPGPQTFSSMPAAFTGHHRPAECLEGYPGDTHWKRRLAAIEDHMHRHASVAERLRERGYATAAFSPNPWTSTVAGFDAGFDVFEDFSGRDSGGRLRRAVRRLPGVDADAKPVQLGLDMLTGRSFFASWESMYDRIDTVRRQLPEPYFLWVFLLDTHYPFLPGRAHRTEQSTLGSYLTALRSEATMRGHSSELSTTVEESVRASYRDTVRAVDDFLDRFATDAADDDPAIVVHADHGESFGEHGNYGHHHREVYAENVHVPYLVHGVDTTATVADPVSLTTIPEVCLSLATDGTVHPERLADRTAIASSEGGSHRAVQGRRFKYVDSATGTALYDLATDPGETTDVATDHPEVCRRRRERLDRFERQRAEVRALSGGARTVAANRRF